MLDLKVGNTRNVLYCRCNHLRLLLQPLHAGTEDSHDDCTASTTEDFLDPFLEIGQQVAREAGISVDDTLDLCDGAFIRRAWIQADPELGEVGSDNFISNFSASDV